MIGFFYSKDCLKDTPFKMIVFCFHYKDCPAGYFGKNCTDKCKYPLAIRLNFIKSFSEHLQFLFELKFIMFLFHSEDCPAGYYGKNCTDKCNNHTFGLLCLETCDCPVCHHIVGCVSTTVNIGIVD